MKILVVAIGRLKPRELKTVENDYVKRINRYQPFTSVEIKTGKEIAKIVREGDLLIGLDEHGEELDSLQFANWLETQLSKHKRIVFFIGDDKGLGSIKNKVNILVSLSKMTIQHDLAKILLLEQLYRACTIMKGERYHK